MKNSLSIITMILASISPWIARAQPLASAPTDPLRNVLSKERKSKTARQLGKAFSLLKEGKFLQCNKITQPLLDDFIFSDYAHWITGISYVKEAHRQYEKKKYAQSIELAKKSIPLFLRLNGLNPYSPLLKNIGKDSGQAEILIGGAYARLKKWPLALSNFEKGLQRLSNQNALGILLVDLLRDYSKACSTNPSDLCASWVHRLVSAYPRNSEEAKALLQFHPGFMDKYKSPPYFPKSTQSYKSPDQDVIAFEPILATFLESKHSNVISNAKKFMDDYPKSALRFRVRYLMASSLMEDREKEKAKKAFEELQHDSPLTYYGMLSAFESGRGLTAEIRDAVPKILRSDPYLHPADVLHLKRAELLIAEKANDLASIELKDFKGRERLSSPFLLYLAFLNSEAGNFNTAFSILGDLVQRGYDGAISDFSLKMIFPLLHQRTVEKYALENSLDPVLVLSLIKQESAFDSGINSTAGAVGLMQLMPTTALEVDGKILRSELTDIDTNIRLGTKYLRTLATRYKENFVYALAAYNAGPAAVDRWIKEGSSKQRKMIQFIESIPYRETREYVSGIIRNYYWYANRMSSGTTVRELSSFWSQPQEDESGK